MNLNVNRQRVKDSPPYDESTTVDRAYEKDFHRYYGDIQPSDQAQPSIGRILSSS